ncbi:MAG: NlpC/P60 family protein [bacterium]
MQKHLSYILILIILIGISFPWMAHAETYAECMAKPNANPGFCSQNSNSTPSTTQATAQTSFPPCTSAATYKVDSKGFGWENGDSCTDTRYALLAPLPCEKGTSGCDVNGQVSSFDPTQANNIGAYLNMMIRLFIGICSVLAVIMIIMGGIEYMTSELVSSKEAGRERIQNALFGLLLAFGAYTLLYTINPDLLKSDLKSLTPATVEVNLNDLGGFSSTPSVPIQKNALQALGIKDCTGSGGKASVTTIANEFIGKTKYSMPNRNTISGSTINVDCTSFIDQVYSCAGLTPPYITSGNITGVATSANGKKVDGKTFDFNTLNPGDTVGWEGNGTISYGHMAIYIGNGQLIDTNSHGNTQIIPVSQYKDKITFVRWP